MPTIESHCGGSYIVRGREYGREGMLVQTDYDFPGTAGIFGWSVHRVQRDKAGKARFLARVPRDYRKRAALGYCEHSSTDGTIDCRECGCTAGDFINAATAHLDRVSS